MIVSMANQTQAHDEAVLAVLTAETQKLDTILEKVRGRGMNNREVDRALQRLKKKGLSKYTKADKNVKAGWTRVQ